MCNATTFFVNGNNDILVKVNYAVVRLHIKNTKTKIKQKHKKVQKQTETTLDK